VNVQHASKKPPHQIPGAVLYRLSMPASSEWLYAFDNDKNLRVRQKHANIMYKEMRSRLKVSECHALLDAKKGFRKRHTMRQLIYETLKIGRRAEEIFYPENLDSEEEVDVESEDDDESLESSAGTSTGNSAGSSVGSSAGSSAAVAAGKSDVVAEPRVFPRGFRQKQWYMPDVCVEVEADEEDY